MQLSLQPQMESPRHYLVTLVEEAVVPQGAEGDNWCRYVLESQYGTITGWRRGSLQEINQHATRYADDLNMRSDQGTSLWSLRRKKAVPGS